MLKFRKEKGKFIVKCEGREMIFYALHDALEYVFYQRFIALVSGKSIGCRNNTLYPVHSLRPPVVSKTTYFYDLGAETL